MIVKLLAGHHLECLSLKKAAEARLRLHLSNCHIVGNLVHWLVYLAWVKTTETPIWCARITHMFMLSILFYLPGL